MPYRKYPLLKKKGLKTQSIKKRKSLVGIKKFVSPYNPDDGFFSFIRSFPNMLASKDLLELVEHMKNARNEGKPIAVGLGPHIIKVGLSRIIIDLMERGWISSICANGAFMIHDFEIALAGKTSENVADTLLKGTFGNTEETGLFLNHALKEGCSKNFGAGEAVGDYLIHANFTNNKYSIMYNAYKLNIPVTIHPSIGTDFIHFHPSFDGSVTGAVAENDFQLFSSIVSKMSDGGIYLNIGSAVILPEVFLKAVACCTAHGIKMKAFYTAVFDFNRQYRPFENVVNRPTKNGGKGFYFVGHHEIMIPLLAAILLNTKK